MKASVHSFGKLDTEIGLPGADERVNWPLVKICGVFNEEELHGAMEADPKPNAIGFLLVPTAADRVDVPGADRTKNADLETYPNAEVVGIAEDLTNILHKEYPRTRGVMVTHEWNYMKVALIAAAMGADAIQIHDQMPNTDLPRLRHTTSVKMLRRYGVEESDAECLVRGAEAPAIERRYHVDQEQAEKLISAYVEIGKTICSGWSTPQLATRLSEPMANALKKNFGVFSADAASLGSIYAAIAAERVNEQTDLEASAENCFAVAVARTFGLSIEEAKKVDVDIPKVELFKAVHIQEAVGNGKSIQPYARWVARFANSYTRFSDGIILDTAAKISGESRIGGTGTRPYVPALLEVLKRIKRGKIILAGGLNSENVAQAVYDAAAACSDEVCIAGADVNTGVEVDGRKSTNKVGEFTSQAQAALLWAYDQSSCRAPVEGSRFSPALTS